MTDTQAADGKPFMLRIPVTKAGKDFFVEIDTNAIPAEVFEEAVKLGLKDLMGRGMSKLTKAAYGGDEAKLAAAQAGKNLEAINAGSIRFSGGKKKVAKGAIQSEAVRLAKALVKKGLKDQGYKVSEVATKDITRLANELLETEQGAALLTQAAANVEARNATTVALDFTKLNVQIDPKKVEANAKKRGATKAAGNLSATQAKKPGKRAKKGAQAQA